MPATIDDTYAEAFRSIYAAVLITARDRYWLDRAVQAATGNASSTILCDCEAGLDRYVDADATPRIDRPGAIVQFHVPRFHKDREARLERSLLVRISQNVLTCPDHGRVQRARCEREVVPAWAQARLFRRRITSTRPSGSADAAGWCRSCAASSSSNGAAAGPTDSWAGTCGSSGRPPMRRSTPRRKPPRQLATYPGVILPFPGGVAVERIARPAAATSSPSPALMLSTARHCGAKTEWRSRLPEGVASVQEIIINGADLPTIMQATQAAIAAAKNVSELLTISAGNYGGRLGKSFIYLHPEKQPT